MVNIAIMRTFVRLRQILANHKANFRRAARRDETEYDHARVKAVSNLEQPGATAGASKRPIVASRHKGESD